MSKEDKRIRELAHQIWESEGKPDGAHDRHWEMARKLAEAEALTPSKPKPAAKPKTAPKAAAKPNPVAAKPAAKKPTAPKKPKPPAP
ncbi:hypothetical protein PseBG33_2667 [Pseudomonas synxantha BG33R]|jgi:hypothetical protein|uniref:DUF2934 domain-containing protein n=1 Tax=Pseudomonas synxantha TaxID=47883 RepID=A0A5D3G746_9PSED|nr:MULTISPECIES: DUF2934 domain-containing protein [Pseudomonas]EIK69007.1 hypothetical protein PseBG33_2667 [Pseudomonas synxantha BG33R]KFF47420.1 hypothetical protein JH25_27505 [Pseudomonas sp. BRG-100]MBY8974112.1 DUF2934 domain-containing protein [Pseudomonas sp. P867]MCK3829024.1 DUF2934 domain-containing protein [Pseudomonas sp. W2Aug9]MCK3832959.1 DUF2934 domain-containing protein [Pseudomonas fluorescens]